MASQVDGIQLGFMRAELLDDARRQLAELGQMCDAPTDVYSRGAWADAANDALELAHTFAAAFDGLCGALDAVASVYRQ
jgi:hypothetical protein